MPEDEFLELSEFDMDRLLVAWQEAVFTLYLAEGKIEPEVVEDMRSWPHSGFSVDQSVFLPANDSKGIERLSQYMTRCHPVRIFERRVSPLATWPTGVLAIRRPSVVHRDGVGARILDGNRKREPSFAT